MRHLAARLQLQGQGQPHSLSKAGSLGARTQCVPSISSPRGREPLQGMNRRTLQSRPESRGALTQDSEPWCVPGRRRLRAPTAQDAPWDRRLEACHSAAPRPCQPAARTSMDRPFSACLGTPRMFSGAQEERGRIRPQACEEEEALWGRGTGPEAGRAASRQPTSRHHMPPGAHPTGALLLKSRHPGHL